MATNVSALLERLTGTEGGLPYKLEIARQIADVCASMCAQYVREEALAAGGREDDSIFTAPAPKMETSSVPADFGGETADVDGAEGAESAPLRVCAQVLSVLVRVSTHESLAVRHAAAEAVRQITQCIISCDPVAARTDGLHELGNVNPGLLLDVRTHTFDIERILSHARPLLAGAMEEYAPQEETVMHAAVGAAMAARRDDGARLQTAIAAQRRALLHMIGSESKDDMLTDALRGSRADADVVASMSAKLADGVAAATTDADFAGGAPSSALFAIMGERVPVERIFIQDAHGGKRTEHHTDRATDAASAGSSSHACADAAKTPANRSPVSSLWTLLRGGVADAAHALLNPAWHARHGAALLLKATWTALLKAGAVPVAINVDVCLRCVAVLVLDRVSDFSADMLVAPVREAAADVLAAGAAWLPLAVRRAVTDMLLNTCCRHTEWHVRHAAWLAARALVCGSSSVTQDYDASVEEAPAAAPLSDDDTVLARRIFLCTKHALNDSHVDVVAASSDVLWLLICRAQHVVAPHFADALQAVMGALERRRHDGHAACAPLLACLRRLLAGAAPSIAAPPNSCATCQHVPSIWFTTCALSNVATESIARRALDSTLKLLDHVTSCPSASPLPRTTRSSRARTALAERRHTGALMRSAPRWWVTQHGLPLLLRCLYRQLLRSHTCDANVVAGGGAAMPPGTLPAAESLAHSLRVDPGLWQQLKDEVAVLDVANGLRAFALQSDIDQLFFVHAAIRDAAQSVPTVLVLAGHRGCERTAVNVLNRWRFLPAAFQALTASDGDAASGIAAAAPKASGYRKQPSAPHVEPAATAGKRSRVLAFLDEPDGKLDVDSVDVDEADEGISDGSDDNCDLRWTSDTAELATNAMVAPAPMCWFRRAQAAAAFARILSGIAAVQDGSSTSVAQLVGNWHVLGSGDVTADEAWLMLVHALLQACEVGPASETIVDLARTRVEAMLESHKHAEGWLRSRPLPAEFRTQLRLLARDFDDACAAGALCAQQPLRPGLVSWDLVDCVRGALQTPLTSAAAHEDHALLRARVSASRTAVETLTTRWHVRLCANAALVAAVLHLKHRQSSVLTPIVRSLLNGLRFDLDVHLQLRVAKMLAMICGHLYDSNPSDVRLTRVLRNALLMDAGSRLGITLFTRELLAARPSERDTSVAHMFCAMLPPLLRDLRPLAWEAAATVLSVPACAADLGVGRAEIMLSVKTTIGNLAASPCPASPGVVSMVARCLQAWAAAADAECLMTIASIVQTAMPRPAITASHLLLSVLVTLLSPDVTGAQHHRRPASALSSFTPFFFPFALWHVANAPDPQVRRLAAQVVATLVSTLSSSEHTMPACLDDAPDDIRSAYAQGARFMHTLRAGAMASLHHVPFSLQRRVLTGAIDATSQSSTTYALGPHADSFPTAHILASDMRPYQRVGAAWLTFLQEHGLHGMLADEMGLGKTLQVLAALQTLVSKDPARCSRMRSLVVCPASICRHWVQEVARWCGSAGGLRAVLAGPDTLLANGHADDGETHTLVVASYATARTLSKQMRGSTTTAAEPCQLLYMIVDEAHVMRNPKTATYAAIARLGAHALYRVACTGTPVHNSPADLWSVFSFLMPGFLGEWEEFHAAFLRPVERARRPAASQDEVDASLEILTGLHRKLLPFVLRRVKSDVLPELPPKVVQDVIVEMPAAQRACYERVLQQIVGSESHVLPDAHGSSTAGSPSHESALRGFAALNALIRACNHPALEEVHGGGARRKRLAATDSAKLLALCELMVDLGVLPESAATDATPSPRTREGAATTAGPEAFAATTHKMLVYARSPEFLDVIEDVVLRPHLPARAFKRLDARTPVHDRAAVAATFNTSADAVVLLISSTVGGMGLNLSGADIVVFLEHDWNPMNDTQAMDRAHRIGQRKHVHVFRVLCADTIEERILSLQSLKSRFAAAIINDKNALPAEPSVVVDALRLIGNPTHGGVSAGARHGVRQNAPPWAASAAASSDAASRAVSTPAEHVDDMEFEDFLRVTNRL